MHITTCLAALAFCGSALWAQSPQIIDNPAPDPGKPAFRISAMPVTTITSPLPERPLRNVLDAVVAVSGRVAVLGFLANEPGVWLFNSDGALVRQLAGRSEALGEFRIPRMIATLNGDSLLVLEPGNRATLIDSSGKFIRSASVESARAICCSMEGGFIEQSVVGGEPTQPASQPYRIRYSYLLRNVHDGGAATRRLFIADGAESVIRESFPSTERSGANALMTHARPFSRTITVAFAGSEIVYAVGGRYELEVYSASGQKLRIVRVAVDPVPVTAQDIEEARAQFLNAAPTPERRQLREKLFAELQHPATLPAFGQVMTEETGRIWVRNYAWPVRADQWWAAFDSSGRLLGTLNIPADRLVLRFTRDHVILTEPPTAAPQTRRLYVHRLEQTSD